MTVLPIGSFPTKTESPYLQFACLHPTSSVRYMKFAYRLRCCGFGLLDNVIKDNISRLSENLQLRTAGSESAKPSRGQHQSKPGLLATLRTVEYILPVTELI